MPVISAKIIKKPRIIRFCSGFRHHFGIPIIGPQVRLYGNAFTSDPPYVLYECLECAQKDPDAKVRKVLQDYATT